MRLETQQLLVRFINNCIGRHTPKAEMLACAKRMQGKPEFDQVIVEGLPLSLAAVNALRDNSSSLILFASEIAKPTCSHFITFISACDVFGAVNASSSLLELEEKLPRDKICAVLGEDGVRKIMLLLINLCGSLNGREITFDTFVKRCGFDMSPSGVSVPYSGEEIIELLSAALELKILDEADEFSFAASLDVSEKLQKLYVRDHTYARRRLKRKTS